MANKSRTEGGEEQQIGSSAINDTQVLNEENLNGTYNGQVACHFTHNGTDYSLHPGEQYDGLPNSEFVQSLIGQNKLTKI